MKKSEKKLQTSLKSILNFVTTICNTLYSQPFFMVPGGWVVQVVEIRF